MATARPGPCGLASWESPHHSLLPTPLQRPRGQGRREGETAFGEGKQTLYSAFARLAHSSPRGRTSSSQGAWAQRWGVARSQSRLLAGPSVRGPFSCLSGRRQPDCTPKPSVGPTEGVATPSQVPLLPRPGGRRTWPPVTARSPHAQTRCPRSVFGPLCRGRVCPERCRGLNVK